MQWGSVSDWALVVFAGATVYSAWQTHKTAQQLAWFLGALESHSTMRLRLQAQKEGLKVIAYDPAQTKYPGHIPMLGEEWRPLDQIYLALPVEFRKGHKAD